MGLFRMQRRLELSLNNTGTK